MRLLIILGVACLSLFISACANSQPRFLMAKKIHPQANAEQPTVSSIDASQLVQVKSPATSAGITAVQKANKQALVLPNSDDVLNSTIIFPYQPGDLYQIYATPLNVTDIELQAGEKIISVAAGDTMRWQVSETSSGTGADRVEHLLIKPLAEHISTTLLIMTDVRTYHILLSATQHTFMAAVKWRYAGSEIVFNGLSSSQNAEEIIPAVAQSDEASYQLKQLKGSKPAWVPNHIFTHNGKTYIEFPKAMQTAPDLFIEEDGDQAVVANYRVVQNVYVVDQIIHAARLVSDNGGTVIEILRKA